MTQTPPDFPSQKNGSHDQGHRVKRTFSKWSLTTESIKQLAHLTWLTTEEAAMYLRTSVGGIHNKVHRGQLPCYRQGRKLLFKRMELDRLIEVSRRGG